MGDAEIPVVSKVNVIVAGGGIAGLPAAVAAGRNEVDVLLIESCPFLGGTATASGMPVMVSCDQASGITRELRRRRRRHPLGVGHAEVDEQPTEEHGLRRVDRRSPGTRLIHILQDLA